MPDVLGEAAVPPTHLLVLRLAVVARVDVHDVGGHGWEKEEDAGGKVAG
jgi:hypothetical protein